MTVFEIGIPTLRALRSSSYGRPLLDDLFFGQERSQHRSHTVTTLLRNHLFDHEQLYHVNGRTENQENQDGS